MNKKILVTGFAPFNAQRINPSQLLLPELEAHFKSSQIQLLTALLPVEQYVAVEKSIKVIETFKPDIVISLGQAAGRDDISIERIAINVDDYPFADNAGNQPIDKLIVKEGESAYFSTLPVKAIVQSICLQGIAASVSNSAGTYVCNHLMYGLLHYASQRMHKTLQVGFIHIPCLPEQLPGLATDKPCASMSLETIQQAVICAIECAAEQQPDIKLASGTVC